MHTAERVAASYNPHRADISAHHRLAGLRDLCNHPIVLACDPSSGRLLGRAEGIAISDSGTALDRDVDCGGHGYSTMAGTVALPKRMELAAGNVSFRYWSLGVQTLWVRFQRRTTWRFARIDPRSSGTAPGYIRYTSTCSSSGVSRTFVRDGGLEFGKRIGGLLRPDGVGSGHWSLHDSIGRKRTGGTIRRGISGVQAESVCGTAVDAYAMKSIPRRYNRI